MSTLAFINGKLSVPTFRGVLSNHPDRWYLDKICRKDITQQSPSLCGTQGLTGKGVTVFIISSGVRNSPYFTNRLSWLLGTPDVDWTGAGTGMAFLVGAHRYGVACHCSLISLNVYTATGIDVELYKQAVDLILANIPNGPCLVLSSAVRTPAYGYMIVEEDLDPDTKRMLMAGMTVVVPAGDGFINLLTGGCLGPILAEACHPAHLEDVITVSALSEDLTLPLFANYGYAVDVFAPGDDVVTLDNTGQFVGLSTTRTSAAIVAGILAMYLEKLPKATRADLQKFVKEHSSIQPIAVPYPLDRLQKDPFFSEEFQYLALRLSSGPSYQYLVDTQVQCRVAHAFFTKAILEKSMSSLGTVLANTQFEVPLNTRFKNLYGEAKTTEFTLLSYTPESVGQLEVGRYSGKLFGHIYDVMEPVTCTIAIQVSDGLYLTQESYTIYIQPNYAELHTIGGVIKARLQNISGLNIHQPSSDVLNIESPLPIPHDVSVNLQRDVRLLDTATGRFMGKQLTTSASGEFLFTVPMGQYRAIVLDASYQYNPVTIDGLRAARY